MYSKFVWFGWSNAKVGQKRSDDDQLTIIISSGIAQMLEYYSINNYLVNIFRNPLYGMYISYNTGNSALPSIYA